MGGETGLQLNLLIKNSQTSALGSDKEVNRLSLSEGALIEITALANKWGTDKYTPRFWSHPLLLVRSTFPFGVNIRDKNKALQITTPLLMLLKYPTGKCTLTKANVAHLGSYSLWAERKGGFGPGNAMHDFRSGY